MDVFDGVAEHHIVSPSTSSQQPKPQKKPSTGARRNLFGLFNMYEHAHYSQVRQSPRARYCSRVTLLCIR